MSVGEGSIKRAAKSSSTTKAKPKNAAKTETALEPAAAAKAESKPTEKAKPKAATKKVVRTHMAQIPLQADGPVRLTEELPVYLL